MSNKMSNTIKSVKGKREKVKKNENLRVCSRGKEREREREREREKVKEACYFGCIICMLLLFSSKIQGYSSTSKTEKTRKKTGNFSGFIFFTLFCLTGVCVVLFGVLFISSSSSSDSQRNIIEETTNFLYWEWTKKNSGGEGGRRKDEEKMKNCREERWREGEGERNTKIYLDIVDDSCQCLMF